MTTIKRGQLPPAPVLPEETVSVPSLGGDVIVRGLLLSQQMALHAKVARATAAPAEGETEEQAGIRARSLRVAETLAMCVVLDDGKPLYTVEEWDVFGAKNTDDAMRLYETAQRLNGEDEEAATKN